MGIYPAPGLPLLPPVRAQLERLALAHDAGLPRDRRAGLRASIVLAAATGLANSQIAQQLGVSPTTVRAVRRRFAARGVLAMYDTPPPGRPPHTDQLTVMAVTLCPPNSNSEHARWSTRDVAAHLNVSPSTVARVWRKWGVLPASGGAVRLLSTPPLDVAAGLGAALLTWGTGALMLVYQPPAHPEAASPPATEEQDDTAWETSAPMQGMRVFCGMPEASRVRTMLAGAQPHILVRSDSVPRAQVVGPWVGGPDACLHVTPADRWAPAVRIVGALAMPDAVAADPLAVLHALEDGPAEPVSSF